MVESFQNEHRKRGFAAFAAGFLLGVGVEILECKFPRHKYETTEPLPLGFRILDNVLEFSVMRFIKVYSHRWHWRNIKYDPKFDEYGVPIEIAPSGNPDNIPFYGVIAHLGGRPYGYLVDLDRNALEPSSELPRFTIGYRNPRSNNIRLCTLEQTKPVMLLAGPDQGCTAYAFDKKNQPLPLVKLSSLMHRNQLPSDIRVL